ncbi:DDE-type integrase/transposase/recombinase [Streptomyces sp. NBC_01007]|nr:DDE-type integrase/transposase/recombinase [Streptomyces sp. NBC_01007]
MDIKKLGNIPDGGGHKTLGRQAGRKTCSGMGYSYLHNAVDDHSRLAYSEILTDEKKETATAFWDRAQTFFAQVGITVQRVLTDNGSCYRSRDWRDALAAAGITHKRTRPYRPRTNGKVERFNRTLLDEWLRSPLPHGDRTTRRLPAVAAHLQSPPRTHRAERPTTRQPRPQPHRAIQLGRPKPKERLWPAKPLGRATAGLQGGDDVGRGHRQREHREVVGDGVVLLLLRGGGDAVDQSDHPEAVLVTGAHGRLHLQHGFPVRGQVLRRRVHRTVALLATVCGFTLYLTDASTAAAAARSAGILATLVNRTGTTITVTSGVGRGNSITVGQTGNSIRDTVAPSGDCTPRDPATTPSTAASASTPATVTQGTRPSTAAEQLPLDRHRWMAGRCRAVRLRGPTP